ncbi:MAG: division/cell wall cluster transcriptional repressor MraZ [Spirochaetota bacterium]
MITGQFRNSLDEKGRLLIPAKIRNEIAGNLLVVTRGIDTCLWVFPPEQWKKVSEGLMAAASPFTKRARLLQRWIIAPAQEVEIDRSGRINIPQALQESAGLERECIVLGLNRYLEIWDVGAYEAYLRDSEDEFQEAAEELGGLISL